MAAAFDNLSRRAVLGGALALSVAPGEGALPPSFAIAKEDPQWRAALAAFRAAEAGVGAAERRTSSQQFGGGTFAAEAALDRLYDRRLDALYRALRLLMKRPAPDLAAFALKFDLLVAHEVAELRGGRLCLAAMRRDLRRLAGTAAAARGVSGA